MVFVWLTAFFILVTLIVLIIYQVPTNKGSICWMWQIFNQLGKEKKRRLFKIVSLIVLLFLSMFWMIWSVLSEEDE